jgi:tetratricopeptide (TPR) repeat protein
MKLLHLFLFLFFPAALWAQCDNLKPMFGDNCEKNAALRKADAKFIKSETKLYGTPDSAAHVYTAKAWSYFYRRDPETAMKCMNQAWLLDPGLAEVYFGFGHLTRYAFAKDAAAAEKYYKLGRDRDPKRLEEPMSLLVMLNIAETRKDLNTAIDVSTQLIQGFPDFGKGFGYKKRAFYYIQAQLFDNALEDSNRALEIDPQDANAYLGRGYAYFWKHEDEKSLTDYNRALELAPNYERVYSSRAQLYLERLDKPDLALADIEKAMQLEPKEPQHYKIKSEILFKLNRTPEACECLKNGMELGNNTLQEDYEQKCKSK